MPGGGSKVVKKQKAKQQRTTINGRDAGAVKTLIDEEELTRFLKGGLAAK